MKARFLACAAAFLVPTLVRADCAYLSPTTAACPVSGCVFLTVAHAQPLKLFAITTSAPAVDVDALELLPNHWLIQPHEMLISGAVYGSDQGDIQVEVRGGDASAFPRGALTAEYAPTPQGCTEEFLGPPLPVVRREDVVKVHLDTGRDPGFGAWMEVWALLPEDEVPPDRPAFSAAPHPPTTVFRFNEAASSLDQPAHWTRPSGFVGYLTAEQANGANRIAARVVEPTGNTSAVFVVNLQDEQQPYLHILGCSSAGLPPWEAVAVLAVMRRRRR